MFFFLILCIIFIFKRWPYGICSIGFIDKWDYWVIAIKSKENPIVVSMAIYYRNESDFLLYVSKLYKSHVMLQAFHLFLSNTCSESQKSLMRNHIDLEEVSIHHVYAADWN